MCYYSSISVSFKLIEDRFGVRFVQSEQFVPVYSASAFTFPCLPVISSEDTQHIVLMQWGLIPFWVKDYEASLTIRQQTLNARAESIFERPAYRYSIATKHCLVLVDGFYEWRHENRKTYPYYIRLTNHEPFGLAGIWNSWHNPVTGEHLKTYSVITTKANALLEKIHNTKKRMPVILPREQEKHWLQTDLDRQTIQSMLQPYAAHEMEAYPVSETRE